MLMAEFINHAYYGMVFFMTHAGDVDCVSLIR